MQEQVREEGEEQEAGQEQGEEQAVVEGPELEQVQDPQYLERQEHGHAGRDAPQQSVARVQPWPLPVHGGDGQQGRTSSC